MIEILSIQADTRHRYKGNLAEIAALVSAT
jgi:hypothetical protein